MQRRLLARWYLETRRQTEALCASLAIEDHVPQPIVEVSPPKWHLGHTAWFFEAVILKPKLPEYRVCDPTYGFVFNSYYESQGSRGERARRGDMSRPTVEQVLAYRAHVDDAMQELLMRPIDSDLAGLIELGIQHEQQHQELLLTDIKVVLGTNPALPAFDPSGQSAVDVKLEHAADPDQRQERWLSLAAGVHGVGHSGTGFAFDNETPRHSVYVAPTLIRSTLVTNGEYLTFMEDGGYHRYEFWHSEGWDWVQSLQVRAPMYWRRRPDSKDGWSVYTLAGLRSVDPDAPVTHVNYFEAHAFCQWAGWRLPTEFEWEVTADHLTYGRRWEWTSSAYLPYPGFRPFRGQVAEYNGKFMLNQMVLRGGSFATPPGHARSTYRNFFHAPLRWQYTGIRPARDA